jgi:hypothetical protein
MKFSGSFGKNLGIFKTFGGLKFLFLVDFKYYSFLLISAEISIKREPIIKNDGPRERRQQHTPKYPKLGINKLQEKGFIPRDIITHTTDIPKEPIPANKDKDEVFKIITSISPNEAKISIMLPHIGDI